MEHIVPYIIIGILFLMILLAFGKFILLVGAYIIASFIQVLAWLFAPKRLLLIAVLLLLFLIILGLS